ncbi:MAG: CBS domain-containing protein, partial [Armatimonadetes bacterium]|nr:CBS domain-containing protein [Candidatus Hippobium faecium]
DNNRLITVKLNDNINTLAEIMKDYNLVCLPVVDEDEELQGVITVDDILECLVK